MIAAACGSTSSNDYFNQGPDGSVATTRAEIIQYQRLSTKVQSAAGVYGATMTTGGVTAAGCNKIHDAYDAQVRPWISSMVQMAGTMDGYISDHSGGSAADMRCAAATMLNELDYHRSVACTFSSLAADQAEAVRDADALTSYANHIWTRCREMLGDSTGACCSWGPMMSGCANWGSTCCSSMMRWGCCGDMMSRGGTKHGGLMHGGSCCASGS